MPRFYVVSRWWRWALVLLLGLLAGAGAGGARAQGVPPGQGLVADSTELRVLRELYAATDGPRWAQRAGWDSLAAWTRLPPNGRLYGVVASLGDVVHLELRGNGLAGPLPAGLGALGQLRVLDLASNRLTGPLPAGLARLTALNHCFLNGNQLSGDLAGRFDGWGDLVNLDVSDNRFTGALPAALGGLPRLYSLGADRNQLTGPVPAALGRLAGLWRLGLAGNRLTGPIPGALGRCLNLRQLFLGGNQLSGALPDSLADIADLDYLSAESNRLTGAIPPGYKRFRALYRLNLADNQLTGPVPDSLRAAFLLLQNNRLSGALPASYGTTRNVQMLFDHNELTRLPYFAQPLGYPNLQLGLTNNCLAFDSYEPNQVKGGVYQFWDYGQRPPGPADTLQALAGRGAQLDGRIGGAYNVYQWQRAVGGQWVDLPDRTRPDLAWAAAGPADAGAYRTRVANTWVPGIVLYSRAHYLDVLPYPAPPRNRPVDASRAQALARSFPAADTLAPAPADVNFVRTWVPWEALTAAGRVPLAPVDSVATATEYLDGLGRPVQTVQRQASPARRDVVQARAYDALGREPRQYLPYPDSVGGRGGYRYRARNDQQQFYRRLGPVGGGPGPLGPNDATAGVARTGRAFAETVFEASPLNRVAAQGAAGEMWQVGAGHVVERWERPNAAADSVPRFAPGYGPAADPGYAGRYAAGELWGTDVADAHGPNEVGAHGYRTVEWKDREGRVVLRQAEAARAGTGAALVSRWLRTAYAYDDFGRLRCVLPPEATRRVLALGDTPAALPAAAAPFVFRYRYDGRGRPIAKQVPGTDGETVAVFDQLDRKVLAQDAAQRGRREWAWTKYDALGRVVLSGLVLRGDTAGQISLQALAAADTAAAQQYEQRTADGAAYPYFVTTDRSFPRLGQGGFGPGTVLAVTHYDDYNFDNDAAGTADAQYNASTDGQFAGGLAPVADAGRTTGLTTRTKTRVLGVAAADPDQAAWLVTTTFYDARARPVQVQTTNARKGRDLLTTQLSFAGQVVQSVAVHEGPHHTPVAVAEFFAYDHTGRLLTTRQQLPGEARPALLSLRHYNELGQLTVDSMGTGRLLQAVKYAYNVRGWLTQLNDPYTPDPADLFSLSLHYDRGFTAGYEQYNGNLTGQTWRGRDGVQRAYGYGYDPLNRLLHGDFVARAGAGGAANTAGAWAAEQDHYGLSFASYDDNGNLLTLRRQGLLANATHLAPKRYGPVDNLSYAYAGNRLQAVDDLVGTNQLPRPAGYNGAPASLAGDFQEQGTHLGQEYVYDANGNLTQDRNKGITGIAYNHLNLPKQVHFGFGADSLVFRYTAAGQKVAKLVYQTGKPVQRTDYLGPYQYEQDSLRFFPHAEGRVLRFANTTSGAVRYQREYSFKDHLGNLRLAYRLGQHRTYTAGMEPGDAARETQQFDSLSVSSPVAQNVGPAARTRQFVARLNAGGPAPQPLGPLTQLVVQKGDTVTVSAPGYYPQPVQNTSFAFSLASFVAGLLQPPPGAPRADGRRGGLPLLSIGISAALPGLVQVGGGVPKGYVRLLVFDADSNLVGSQTQQLSQAARAGYEPLQVQVIAPQDGYVTAYVGNESNADVYFDDVTVTHGQGLQVQETQYDPTGLELAGLTRDTPGLKPLNQYKFNGKEFQPDLGLNWNHQDWRFFDAQLGRWHAVDPEIENGQESWGPYSFGFDNTVRYADANGREPDGPPSVGRGIAQGAIDFAVGLATPLVVPLAQGVSAAAHGDITPLASLLVPAIGMANQAVAAYNGNSETRARVATGFAMTAAVAVAGVKGAGSAGVGGTAAGRAGVESAAQGGELSNGARMVKQPLKESTFEGNLKKPDSFKGAKSGDVKEWLGNNGWSSTGKTKSAGGEVFMNGKKGEQIRLMPGYEAGTRPLPIKTGPYMEMSVGGQKAPTIPLRNNPTL